MITNHSGIPDHFVSESGLDAHFWDFWAEWMELDEDQRCAVSLYWEEVMGSPTDCSHSKHWCPTEVLNNYYGCFDSMEELGDQMFDMCDWWSLIPEQLHSYVDTADYANDCRLGGDIYIVEVGTKLYVYWTH